jgi:hypothetical protein
MGKRGFALLLCFVLSGCTRVIDTAQPRPATPVAPIAAGQVSDLLSEDAKPDEDPNPFVTVEPEECTAVAREVDAPFIFDAKPAAHDGGSYFAEFSRSVSVMEMVGVYRADFDPKAAVDEVKRIIESCQNDMLTVTASEGEVLYFDLLPQSDSGSAGIVLWSFTDVGWACDNAFIAAHNAAVEITTCGEVNGYDVLSLAKDSLGRIEQLAKTTA